MNIDCQNKTITCDCGNTIQIQNAELVNCSDCQPYHFDCDRCKGTYTIPLGFTDFIRTEISKNVLQTGPRNDLGDIFFGQNKSIFAMEPGTV